MLILILKYEQILPSSPATSKRLGAPKCNEGASEDGSS